MDVTCVNNAAHFSGATLVLHESVNCFSSGCWALTNPGCALARNPFKSVILNTNPTDGTHDPARPVWTITVFLPFLNWTDISTSSPAQQVPWSGHLITVGWILGLAWAAGFALGVLRSTTNMPFTQTRYEEPPVFIFVLLSSSAKIYVVA